MSPDVSHNIPILVITGPTASGKTSIAIEVALKLNAELVGADSMQVYRKMDIGTDIPSDAALRGVPHHMIRLIEPDEPYDTARYAAEADIVIAGIHQRKRPVIVVGGTGLYIRVLLNGLQAGPPPDAALREVLNSRAKREGWPALHNSLKEIDPETAARLHPNDGVRIVRALEVFEQTGISISTWQQRHGFLKPRYPFRVLSVEREVDELNARINQRVDQMMEAGFMDEVKALLSFGFSPDLKPMQALGYRRLVAHINGELTLEDAIEKIKTDTRRFSKRQRTWLRGETDITRMAPDIDAIAHTAEHFFGAP